VYELLTDREVDPEPIELEGSAGLYLDPDGYGTQASALRVRGFETYTFRSAGPPDDDLDSLRKIRDRTDEELGIVADAHTWWKLGPNSYDEQQVADLLSEMAAYDPKRVQDPIEPTDTEAYERLLAETEVPIAAGRSAATPSALRDLLETGVDYLVGDVCRHGGFTGCWDLVGSCAERDTQFLPHSFGTRLETVANAHLAAAAPGTVPLEYPAFGRAVADAHPFPLADDLLATDFDVSDGTLTMPESPGLGVEVDESVVEEYPYVEGTAAEYVLVEAPDADAD
jgi:L-alanine-DL-glutamate epimerase-like enolase superfamily enzyme